MDRRGHIFVIPPVRAVAIAAAALLAGCTMCPDPYDYSGPVPNRSAPQNDFRARSNGILPLGAKPMPWPPIVKRPEAAGGDASELAETPTSARRGVPTLADPGVVRLAVDGEPVTVEPVSVLVDPETAAAIPAAAEDRDLSEPENEPEAPAAATPVETSPPTLHVEMPSFAETPGWRPRAAP